MDYGKIYGEMHESGKRFPGYSLGAYVEQIGCLIATFGLRVGEHRLLDYGSGKGYQYLARRYHERWPAPILPHCYDIGIQQLSARPEGEFKGVICTDMLEHIERRDLPGILDELIGFTAPGGFLFLGISCRPTRKKLPGTDRDVHVTIEHPDWWCTLIKKQLAAQHKLETIALHAEFDLGEPPHFSDPDTPIRWFKGIK